MKELKQTMSNKQLIRATSIGLLSLVMLLITSMPTLAQTNLKRGLGAPKNYCFDLQGGKSSPLYISNDSNVEFRITISGNNKEWCTAERVGTSSDIIINASNNPTPSPREVSVIVEVVSREKESKEISIRVTQEGNDFKLDKNELRFNAQGSNNESVNITSKGNWSLVKDQTNRRAKWIKITPENDKGNKRIIITAEKNNTIFDRKAEILFRDENNNEIPLTVFQDKPSTLPIEGYEPLGAGYDISGPYVTEIKKELLDINKLIDDDQIRINPSSKLKAIKESAKNFSSMVNKMSNTTEVNIGRQSPLHTGSVKVAVGYKKDDFISSEQEFATIIEQYRKADVQITNSLTAADLRSYLTPAAAEALNGKNINPQKIVENYGTHVIVGFILGGSYNYWMSANRYNADNSTSLSVIAEVALSSKKDTTKGSESGSNAFIKNTYESYKKNTTSDFNFHEYLEAKGGESQYVSLLKPNFDQWQKSLEKKWDIIDFSGKGIIPLWEFVSDATQKSKLKAYIEKHIKERSVVNEYTPKTLTITAVKADLNTTAGFLEKKSGILLHVNVGEKYILKYDHNLEFKNNHAFFKDKKIDITYKSNEDKSIVINGHGETAMMHNGSYGKLELKYDNKTKTWNVNGKAHSESIFTENIEIRFGDGQLKYRVELQFTVR